MSSAGRDSSVAFSFFFGSDWSLALILALVLALSLLLVLVFGVGVAGVVSGSMLEY